jgi:membrane-bound lytic murein transglycosylase D
MKLLPFAGLAVLLALAGCATPVATDKPAEPAPPTAAAAPAPLPPVIPGGPLQPITAEAFVSPGVAATSAPVDLWDRIRRGFAMPNLDTDLVRQQEQWYSTRPEYIQRMTDRSRKYLFHIVEELERRNMPTELALLPFVESAFNPQAVSSARAAGMWQFMPATGKDFDLKQNVFRDDRRSVLDSTRAALDYLQKLHGMFGDWHLALAAYNWGEGNVGRAVQRNMRMGQNTGYTDISMPNETRQYVPKLQAIKNIVANPDQFRSELPVIENHPYFQTVTIARDMDVELAARLADVKLDDFKALNPQLNRPVILAAGTPNILLPWDNAVVFKRNYEGYTSGKFASWTAWSAPSNMSASEAARRVGMTEADLRAVNTIPPRMVIKAGSVLIVPRGTHRQEDVASHVADNGQLSLAPEVSARRTVIKAGKRDTVASIARRYKVGAGQVAEWNQVAASASFQSGQQVVLFLPARAAVRSAAKTSVRSAGSGKAVIKATARRGPVKKTRR